MIKFKHLNTRLFFAFATLASVVCLFFIKLSSLFVEIAEINVLESLLVEEVQYVSDYLDIYHELPPAKINAISYYQSHQDIPVNIGNKMSLSATKQQLSIDDVNLLIHRLEPPQGKIVWLILDTNIYTTNQPLNSFKFVFLYSISACVILLTLLSSWYLAKLLSNPIRQLTSDVSTHHIGDKIAIRGRDRQDEIGTLASAFEASFEKLQTVLKREQNFTRDVSHELRTPITLIKNTLALNLNKPIENEATEVIEQASNELQQTVEVLLALARQENLNFQAMPILPIIEKSVLNIFNSYPHLSFDVKINIDPKLTVLGNQYLISLLSQNLVNNGFYHGNEGGMTILSQQHTLVFENFISGNEERPYYQGLGHGQYLVKRIAEEMHWKIEVEQMSNLYRVLVHTKAS